MKAAPLSAAMDRRPIAGAGGIAEGGEALLDKREPDRREKGNAPVPGTWRRRIATAAILSARRGDGKSGSGPRRR
ncbi:MAG: hypothetical protein JNK67_02065 [Alphaproteobacteria bacterium]|nr:hypothetical protein [Alphaproteobacteria bacterium]